MTDEEKLFAWLDGELGPAEAAEIEAKVAADPALTRLAEEHRALGSRLHAAFDPIASTPMPEVLLSSLRPSAEVIDIASAARRRRPSALPQWTALAATLAIGIFAGTMIPRGNDAPVSVHGGKIYAASALDRALNKELASNPAGDVRIGLTFRDRAGHICRSFTQQASSGLACRDGSKWEVKGLFGAPEGANSDYRMAAGMDPNLAALVDSRMTGEPLDAAGEKAEREKGWR